MLPHWVRGPTKRNVFNWAYKGRIDEYIKGYGFPEALGSLHPPVFPPHLLSLALSNSQSNIPSLPLLATLIYNQPEARVAMQIAPMDSRSHFPPSQAPPLGTHNPHHSPALLVRRSHPHRWPWSLLSS